MTPSAIIHHTSASYFYANDINIKVNDKYLVI